MGLIRVRTGDECYEQKGDWVYTNGEREWHATSGKYPCGTWKTGQENDLDLISAADGRATNRKGTFSRGYATNPVFLERDTEEKFISSKPSAPVFDADVSDVETLFVDPNSLFDNKGNKKYQGDDEPEDDGKARKRLMYVLAAAVVLYLFRKRLGFG